MHLREALDGAILSARYACAQNESSGIVSLLTGVVVMGRWAHRAIAGSVRDVSSDFVHFVR